MAMGSLDTTTVSLIPDQLIMTQISDMPIFYITDSNLGTKVTKKGKNGLRMSIVMKRKITSEMMTTYFPSLLLTAITFATTFFKPFFFEAALSVNLTTMLVMTTIFISKMEGLPPTSDIKMIDIWLVLCQMVPFAEVVLLTAMEYNRKDQDDKDVVITEVSPKVTAATQTRLSDEMHVEDEKNRKRIKNKGERKSRNSQTTSLVVAPLDENHSEEDSCGLDRSLSVEMHVEGSGEVEPEARWCQRCWIPQLKTIGNIVDPEKELTECHSMLNSIKAIYSFRAKSVAFTGVRELRRLFCGCYCFLQ